MPDRSITRFLQIPTLHVGDIELPRDLERLYELAYNLWWSWSPQANDLFSSIDPGRWAQYRNPVELLINIEPRRWYPLLESDSFQTRYHKVIDAFDAYMKASATTWYQRQHGDELDGPIAYFSMEFGLHQCLAIYSGGLGVLSGDHLKSASDLGVPLVAVGLLYRHGYFQQTIDADGVQQHTYPEYDFTRQPLRPIASATGRPVTVRVPLPGRDVVAKLWLAQVGRVPLILLDTDIPENEPADRPITSTLYVRGREMRLIQELVLGIGGACALEQLGIEPAVWHLNEGHSVFLQLERLRHRLRDEHVPFPAAIADLRRNTVFTTHTPVAAGNERFAADLIEKYFATWCEEVGMSSADLLAYGRGHEGDPQFNLTALAIRTSSRTNGVSVLNAQVASEMWRPLWDDPGDEGPIHAITNGIHTATWLGREVRSLLARHLGSDWQDMLHREEGWAAVHEIDDRELWDAHLAQKTRLGTFVRSRVLEQLARHGASPDELRAVGGLFDPQALTLGFARRFATYKRANLVFADLERLEALLGEEERPVQLVFAGKAHPADRPGQELIQKIFQMSRSQRLVGKVFFLENYDIRMGRMLVQGVDVWLNTPRRPMEASGTSGQKAAANGALNFSILDGWWPEGYNGRNGWVIGSEQRYDSDQEQDAADVASLYDTLGEVLRLYYQREGEAPPREWVARMKESIATLTWKFSAARMVCDYVEKAYLPAGRRD